MLRVKRAETDNLSRLKAKHPQDAPPHSMCVLRGLALASIFRECPDTHIACYNMLDPKSSMLKNVLFSGSYQSYNERVIGLSKHCLS